MRRSLITGSCMLIVMIIFFLSCRNKKQSVNENKEVVEKLHETEKINNYEISNKVEDGKLNDSVSQIELEIEQFMDNFEPAIKFVAEYQFIPINNYNLNLVDFRINEQSYIDCYYSDTVLCTIDAISGEINQIYNECIPSQDARKFSAALSVKIDNDFYYCVINLEKGILKLYKSLQAESQQASPFYSGDSQYFIIENDRIVKPSYYDYKSFKEVQAIYGGYIEMYDFNTNELVYKIDERLLHETIHLFIDKIEYEDDGFRITIGNHYDSDEYVDFKLFTDNDNFRYEIYDKYSYSDE